MAQLCCPFKVVALVVDSTLASCVVLLLQRASPKGASTFAHRPTGVVPVSFAYRPSRGTGTKYCR